MIFNLVKRFIVAYHSSHHFRNSLAFAITFKYKKKNILKFNGQKLIIRNNLSDEKVLHSTFMEKYHLPPIKLPENATIVDLGSNIGLTLLDFHNKYPTARIYGVEMDLENFKIARANTSGISKIDILHFAVYTSDEVLGYSGIDSCSFKVDNHDDVSSKVRGITMNGLIGLLKIGKIDYLKIDIEGTEREIIIDENAESWLGKVDVINVELHDHLSSFSFKDDIIRKLNKVGFRVWEHPTHFNGLFAIKI